MKNLLKELYKGKPKEIGGNLRGFSIRIMPIKIYKNLKGYDVLILIPFGQSKKQIQKTINFITGNRETEDVD